MIQIYDVVVDGACILTIVDTPGTPENTLYRKFAMAAALLLVYRSWLRVEVDLRRLRGG